MNENDKSPEVPPAAQETPQRRTGQGVGAFAEWIMTRRSRTTTPDPAFIDEVGRIARETLARQVEQENPTYEVFQQMVRRNEELLQMVRGQPPSMAEQDRRTYGYSQLYASNPSAASIVANIHDEVVMEVPSEPSRETWAEATRWLGPVTGRTRSDQPNLSNIPRSLPLPDYNSLELRTLSAMRRQTPSGLSERQRERLEALEHEAELAADRRFVEDVDRAARLNPNLSESFVSVRDDYQRLVAEGLGIPTVFLLPPQELEDEGEVEVVARTTTRRRSTPTGHASSPTKNPPVYVWTMLSSTPTKGGQVPQYEVRLNEDGSLSCNCPSWIYKKKDARGCKHTRHIEAEAADFYDRHRRGEDLPTTEPTEAQKAVMANSKKKRDASSDGSVQLGRFIDLD